jgi:hypothetical protein
MVKVLEVIHISTSHLKQLISLNFNWHPLLFDFYPCTEGNSPNEVMLQKMQNCKQNHRNLGDFYLNPGILAVNMCSES